MDVGVGVGEQDVGVGGQDVGVGGQHGEQNVVDQSQRFLNLSTRVSPSVVAVEDKYHGEFWVGCIIHKTLDGDGIFILTQSKFIKAHSQLYVHFHDNYEAQVEPLVCDSIFAVLYLDEQHGTSTTVRFRTQGFTFSDALCVIPKTQETFQSIPGFIPLPSCASNGVKRANERSGDYFLFMCHQEDTPTITPAPVFHKDEDVNGFVIKDCSLHGDDKKVDVHMKICLKSTRVVDWLKRNVNQEDWKNGLELKRKTKDVNAKDQKTSKGAGKRPRSEPESKTGKQTRGSTRKQTGSVTGEDLHHGTPANPVSPSLVPGGSCSGSAVAVAAQLVDFAIGTDTIGDIRIPASFCDLLWFKPSYGVISTLGTIANSQSLDTIGWFARDPCILHRVGQVLLPAAAGGLKKTRQILFADDCFQLLKVSNQKTVHAIKNAVQALRGYHPPKHINIGQYIFSNVPSLKEFCQPATKLQEGTSALKAISTVMLLLQRYEFKANHEEWANTVKPKLGLDVSTRVLRAVNFTHENIKSLYAIRNELQAALKNLLKDTGILVLPITSGYLLKRNSKERLSSGFEDRMYKFVGIAALSGCCEVTIPMENLDHHVSLSFVAAHGSDKFLLRTILDTYSLIQDQVVLASKLESATVTNVDVNASELLKEKGNSAFKRRQWSKAIEFYSEAISLSDTNATYYCNRAAAYLELGCLMQAEADCDRTLLLDRKNVIAYLQRGSAREATLNHKEALQDFRHALALEPQNKTALAAETRLQKLLK